MAMTIHKSGKKSVGAGLSTVTVTFSNDDQEAGTPAAFPTSIFAAWCVPDWATSVRITAISTTAVTFTFGTATGGSTAGNIYWGATGT